ncbi:MAG TPA: histidine--tRNA ligase [Candidatus Sulfomarinibacteraceae bacterium]|nr:histidine--tRNA ligase [Candidatus Sulfomarinibacteraceae bacterium]
MTAIQRVTGMQDVLPAERRYWDMVLAKARDLATRYGFERLDVPIIEYTELFARGVGTASDFFVQKEMYTIQEDEETSITLRPEFTAGVVRAYLENGLMNETQPVKVYTVGPIFRRERPQAGRYRQHSQFNCEILGEIDPAADVEVMMLAMDLYGELGFEDLGFQLNSTGCPECKPAYVEKLTAYLQQHSERLSEIDHERMRRNPLRVLDSKEPGMDALLARAPHIADHLCPDCEDHFADLRRLLDALGVKYAVNFRLVRGIDYYVKTVFEVWAEGIGAQAALCGGGRYDGLAEAIGGPPTPGVGFGSGVERIILGLKEQGLESLPAERPDVMITHFGGETRVQAVVLADELRDAGISTWLAFARDRRSMKSQMREADKRDVKYTLILGEDELSQGKVAVRPMVGGEQQLVGRSQLAGWLKAHSEGSGTT